jgi:hypothetical protein
MGIGAVAIILIWICFGIWRVKNRMEESMYLDSAIIFLSTCATIAIYVAGNVWIWAAWIMLRISRIMLFPSQEEIESQARNPPGIFALVMIALIIGSASSFSLFQHLR